MLLTAGPIADPEGNELHRIDYRGRLHRWVGARIPLRAFWAESVEPVFEEMSVVCSSVFVCPQHR